MIDGYVAEWLGLVGRWFHLTMGIAWIGASFYFVWLNNAVRPLEDGEAGVAGDVWSVHGGAFYRVIKYAGAPARLPRELHWFKWEAYLTWLSGFFLLVLHWWSNAATTMVDPAVRSLSAGAAVGIGAATLVGGWALYDGLCRSPLARRPRALGVTIAGIVVAAAFGLSQVFSARAAWLHVGAMLGTWMAGNVLMVIIPGQRAIVDALIAGTPPPIERGKAGALRSLHNNYLTLPVLFVMISGHFPSTYGNPHAWLVLLGIAAGGVAIRHAINVAERGSPQPWLWPIGIGALVLVAIGARPRTVEVTGDAVPFTRAQMIVSARCLPCHSERPILGGFAAPPKGLLLDTPDRIRAARALIRAQAVDARIMPLGNLTGMTDEEREELGRWTRGSD